MSLKNAYLQKVYDKVVAKNPNEAEFQQAVYEVLESITPAIEKNPAYEKANIIEYNLTLLLDHTKVVFVYILPYALL